MNEMVNQLVFNVLLALIVALIGIVTKTLLPYLKAKQEAATTALRQTRWAWAADIVDAVVKAVEQTADEYMHGEVKKDTATRMIVDFFRENHIDLTEAQISTLIETAVQELNANTIEVTDYKDTQAIGFEMEDDGYDQGD